MMASSQGKKGKKTKGVTVNLSTFLSNGAPSKISEDGSVVVVTAKAPASSWADEMDDEAPSSGSSMRKAEQIVLPSAPRSARGPDYDDHKIPRDPPYTAHVANLPYDVTEDDLMRFFAKLKIKSIRLPRDEESGRLKGFGYADFEDRDSLVEALAMDSTRLNSRVLRIDLATYSGKGDRDGSGRGGRYGGGSRYADSEDDPTQSDWRSAQGPPPITRDYDRGGFDRDRGSSGGNDRREGGYRSGGGREDREGRSGFDTFDRSQMRPAEEQRTEQRRYGSGSGGSGSSSGDRYDRYDRSSRFDRYDRRDRYDRKDSSDRDPPKMRPKLVLAKRTVDEATVENVAPVSNPAIFGGAKPVDTAKREMEMLERLKRKEEEEAKKAAESSKRAEAKKVSIFGAAKPVDTSAKDREIEERLRKMDIERKGTAAADPEKGQLDEGEGEKRKRIHAEHDRDRPTSRGSGGSGGRRRGERDRDRDHHNRERDRERNPSKGYKKDKSPPPLKKMEETKPPNFAGSNKFSFLQPEDEENDSGKDSE